MHSGPRPIQEGRPSSKPCLAPSLQIRPGSGAQLDEAVAGLLERMTMGE